MSFDDKRIVVKPKRDKNGKRVRNRFGKPMSVVLVRRATRGHKGRSN